MGRVQNSFTLYLTSHAFQFAPVVLNKIHSSKKITATVCYSDSFKKLSRFTFTFFKHMVQLFSFFYHFRAEQSNEARRVNQ